MTKPEKIFKTKYKVPDVICYNLERALQKLDQLGIAYLIRETIPVRPPGSKADFINESSVLRVIRQKIINNQMVELVVAREIAALSQGIY